MERFVRAGLADVVRIWFSSVNCAICRHIEDFINTRDVGVQEVTLEAARNLVCHKKGEELSRDGGSWLGGVSFSAWWDQVFQLGCAVPWGGGRLPPAPPRARGLATPTPLRKH